MLWCEVRITVPLPDVETTAEVLRVVAPGGVSIEEPVVPLGPEEGARLERHRPAIVSCYLLVDDGLGARLDQIDALLDARELKPEIETRRVDEAEWADAWKEHFHVMRVGRRTVIRPSWRDYQPGPGDVVIDLDPGMAFGTGQHETTRGCLAMLEEIVRPGMRVLDAGTGSGILAIAAIKLGAASVMAVDVEPQAISVTRENAARNGVGQRVRVAHGSLGAAWPFDDPSAGIADLVVANIHARALIELAEDISAALTPAGAIILSGIIAEREADVRDAYAALGFSVTNLLAEGDWRTLALRPAG
ncbi:MAG: 50S ribosomal protein L11 methyltransferase [Dehalococcoidia bacterium]